jgi:hypothetical protein
LQNNLLSVNFSFHRPWSILGQLYGTLCLWNSRSSASIEEKPLSAGRKRNVKDWVTHEVKRKLGVQNLTALLRLKILHVQEIQDGNRDRATDLVSWPRDPAEKLETSLTEVKLQREPKIRHSKDLDRGSLLHTTI